MMTLMTKKLKAQMNQMIMTWQPENRKYK